VSRPPIGSVAMTTAERAKRYRERWKLTPDLRVAVHAAAEPLHLLWLAVLHSGPPVDATEELRARISAIEDEIRAIPGQIRELRRNGEA
jgi:hypothetical protein